MIEHRHLLKILNVHLSVRDHLSNRFPEGPTHVEVRGKAKKGGRSQVEACAIDRARLSIVLDSLDRAMDSLGKGSPTFHQDIIRGQYWECRRPSYAISELGLSRSTYYRRRDGALGQLLWEMGGDLTDDDLRGFFVAYSSVFGRDVNL